MTTRRQFLASGTIVAGGLASAATSWSRNAPSAFPYSEFESRIGRRDFRDITKDVLPTPCMLVEFEIFEQNIRKMADYSKTVSINMRPHVKVHKCVQVAKRQIELGAIGLT